MPSQPDQPKATIYLHGKDARLFNDYEVGDECLIEVTARVSSKSKPSRVNDEGDVTYSTSVDLEVKDIQIKSDVPSIIMSGTPGEVRVV